MVPTYGFTVNQIDFLKGSDFLANVKEEEKNRQQLPMSYQRGMLYQQLRAIFQIMFNPSNLSGILLLWKLPNTDQIRKEKKRRFSYEITPGS